jgi:hypothetical protein
VGYCAVTRDGERFMATFGVLIFVADNLTNPQNPGFFPAEDNSNRSDLRNGDQLTWNGGGESAFIEIDDPSGTSFDDLKPTKPW